MKKSFYILMGLFLIYAQSAFSSPTDVLIYNPNTGKYTENGNGTTLATNPCGIKQGQPCTPTNSPPEANVCYNYTHNDVGGNHCMYAKWRAVYDKNTEKASCVCRYMWTCTEGYFGTPQDDISNFTCYVCGRKNAYGTWTTYQKQTSATNGPISGITSKTGYNTTADTCVCDIGYHNPTGMTTLPFGQYMQCDKCPESGTTAQTDSEITQCYIPKDTAIGDTSGTYTYTSNCFYTK